MGAGRVCDPENHEVHPAATNFAYGSISLTPLPLAGGVGGGPASIPERRIDPVELAQQGRPRQRLRHHAHAARRGLALDLFRRALRRIVEIFAPCRQHHDLRFAGPLEEIEPHEAVADRRADRQRAMIAMALSCKPSLLIADEPTTALDVTIQAQILQLIRALQDEMQMGVIFITHDMGVVAEVADRVLVMYRGESVEEGVSEAVFAARVLLITS